MWFRTLRILPPPWDLAFNKWDLGEHFRSKPKQDPTPEMQTVSPLPPPPCFFLIFFFNLLNFIQECPLTQSRLPQWRTVENVKSFKILREQWKEPRWNYSQTWFFPVWAVDYGCHFQTSPSLTAYLSIRKTVNMTTDRDVLHMFSRITGETFLDWIFGWHWPQHYCKVPGRMTRMSPGAHPGAMGPLSCKKLQALYPNIPWVNITVFLLANSQWEKST